MNIKIFVGDLEGNLMQEYVEAVSSQFKELFPDKEVNFKIVRRLWKEELDKVINKK